MNCATCGSELRPNDRFCSNCGAPVHGALARTEDEAELKQVSVLFADIAGSTSLIESLDPEEAAALIGSVIRVMVKAVEQYGGTSLDELGDGILAVFGAPTSVEDHARRACEAGLEIPPGVTIATGGRAQVRVGIHAGETYVRAGRPTGLPLHVAARLQQMAEPGQIIITESTLRLAGAGLQAKPLGMREVRGVAEPLALFALEGVGPRRHDWEGRTAANRSPFVGREVEFAQLARAAARAKVGGGQIVAVVGEPGVGKTRLVHEFVQSLGDEFEVLETGASPYGGTTVYAPFLPLLANRLGVVASEATAADVARGVAGLGLSPDLAPALTSLFGSEDAAWRSLGPDLRRRRTREAIIEALAMPSGERPVVILVEDLHWSDSESQAVLDDLTTAIATRPILLLVTYRPEHTHRWAGLGHYREIWMEGLERDQAADLVASLVGNDPSVRSLERAILDRTGGVPLFIEETVGALAASGALEGTRGAYRSTTAGAGFDIPDTVQSVIAARIDRLDPVAKRTLQAAAVVGPEFSGDILSAMLGLPAGEIEEALGRLCDVDLINQKASDGSPEFRMKHALVRDAAYAGLPPSRRRELHRAALAALESSWRGGTDHLELLAQHAAAAGSWEAGARYARAAGERALDRVAYWEAVRLFELAIECLDELPKTDDNLRAAIEVRTRLRPAQSGAGSSFAAATQHLDQAEALARRLGDPAALLGVRTQQAYHLSVMGIREPAVQAGEEAIELATQIGERLGLAEARLALSQIYVFSGPPRLAVELLLPDVDFWTQEATFERHGQTGIRSVFALGHLATCFARLGQISEAMTRLDAASRIADAASRPFDLFYVSFVRGIVSSTIGEDEAAVINMRQALAVAYESDLRYMQDFSTPYLGLACAQDQLLAESHALLDHYSGGAGFGGLMEVTAALGRSLLARRQGAFGAAAEHADQAWTMARGQGYTLQQVQSLRSLALAHHGLGAQTRPLDWALAALESAIGHEMPTEQGRCHSALARIHSDRGDAAAAATHSEAARSIAAGLGLGSAMATDGL
ncbi:MAG TPA: AAA family ATPase [Acidimicrobiia bacterium]